MAGKTERTFILDSKLMFMIPVLRNKNKKEENIEMYLFQTFLIDVDFFLKLLSCN